MPFCAELGDQGRCGHHNGKVGHALDHPRQQHKRQGRQQRLKQRHTRPGPQGPQHRTPIPDACHDKARNHPQHNANKPDQRHDKPKRRARIRIHFAQLIKNDTDFGVLPRRTQSRAPKAQDQRKRRARYHKPPLRLNAGGFKGG